MVKVYSAPNHHAGGTRDGKSLDPKKLNKNAAITMKAKVCLKGILIVSLDMIAVNQEASFTRKTLWILLVVIATAKNMRPA
jgi:hypothetical protein